MTVVRLHVDSGGLAFAAKGQPHALRDIEAVVAVAGQQVEVRGQHPRPWTVSVADGRRLQARLDRLPKGLARWSPEDVGVFAATALWTYVAMPFLLDDPAVDVRPLPRTASMYACPTRSPPTAATTCCTWTTRG